MNWFFKLLGHIWLSPITLIVLIGLGIMCIFRQVKLVGKTCISLVFAVLHGSKLSNYMVNGHWAGWSGGGCIVVRTPITGGILAHENCHVLQQMLFGVTFPFVYLTEMLLVKFVKKGRPYYDNRFEVDARAYAAISENQMKNAMR